MCLHLVLEKLPTWVTNGLNVNFSSGSTTLGTSAITDQVIATLAVTAGGSGYTTPPTVTISGGGGSGATATAVLTGDAVTSIIINKPVPLPISSIVLYPGILVENQAPSIQASVHTFMAHWSC